MLTERMLVDLVERRAENLVLADTPQLLEFLDDLRNDMDLRRTVLTELVARWCLSGDDGLGTRLAAMLPSWRTFSDWYNVQLPWHRERTVPAGALGLDAETIGIIGLEAAAKRRLSRLFKVAGFIPVCNDEGAWFLPFEFDDMVDGIAWADGELMASWCDAARRAMAGTGAKGMRLQVRNGPEFASLSGESLMLPLHLAALRQAGDQLPVYDPLRVLATGRFDAEGRLADVAVANKLKAMKAQFRDAVLFGPDAPGEVSERERRFYPLPCGLNRDAVVREVGKGLEQKPDLVKVTARYALGRLPDMRSLVDRLNYNRWNDIVEQLRTLRKGVSARLAADTHLEFLSLFATACCHAGFTKECRECLQEAYGLARLYNDTARMLRLQIDMMVVAQDDGDIAAMRELSDGLSVNLEQYEGSKKTDLLMRYHGTMFQCHSWGTLMGILGCTPDAARQHVEKAVELAFAEIRALPADASDSKRDEVQSNAAQDLNYRHLWHAIFMPGTEAETAAFEEAQQQQAELSEGSCKTNCYHLMRQRSLAIYNVWLKNGNVAEKSLRDQLRLPKDDAEHWLVCANRRHLGALAAAAGEVAEAKICFAEGEQALPMKKIHDPVLASIRFALLVQASLSLRARGAVDEGECYVKLAEQLYDRFGESRLFGLMHASTWIAALRTGSAPDALPQFYY